LHAKVVHTETVDGVWVSVIEVANGLSQPWGAAFLPDGSGRALVTERDGEIRLVETKTGKVSPPLAGVPKVYAQGQGGLLDIALSPTFTHDQWVYVSYAEPHKDGARTAVSRLRFAVDRFTESNVVFRQAQGLDNGYHFGSRLAFALDGKSLFVTTGDRYDQKDEAQNKNSHHGKVLRVTLDGKPVPDNPYARAGDAGAYVWSIGHRNVQGAAIHPKTGKLWTSEHGPKGGDEVNITLAGKNYGWPVVGFGVDYSGAKLHESTAKAGMEAPAHYWVPSIGTSGIGFYTGHAIPKWTGRLFVAGLASRSLAMLTLDGEKIVKEDRLLEKMNERIRHVVTAPDGFLYVLTGERNGRLLRIEAAK
jgi:glucose/arabinose dehydrogenase